MEGFGIILIDNTNTDPYKTYENDIACFNQAYLSKYALTPLLASFLLFYAIIKW